MAWTKLDDQFPDHPKVLAAGPLASWLYVCGLSYCGRLLTDGFIPDAQVRKLADLEDAAALAERLVAVGLWERVEGGFLVHDYLDYQPTKERVLQTREVRAEAGSKGGKQRASNLLEAGLDGATNNVEAKSNPVPYPSRTRIDPTSDPESLGADAPPTPKPKRATAMTDEWMPTEIDLAWAKGDGFPTSQVIGETEKFRDHFKATGKPMKDWDAAWKNWMRRSREFASARASPRNGKAHDLTYYTDVTEPDAEQARLAERERQTREHWRQLVADKSLSEAERRARHQAYQEALT